MGVKTLYLICLMFCVLSPQDSKAQVSEIGVPYIQNYSPREYGYESQNYSIVQDKRGIIYIGNLNGIIEYDGLQWRLIKVSGAPRLVVNEQGIIFAGGYSEFGFLEPNSSGDLVFTSLIGFLNQKDRNFGQVTKIFTLGDEVLFSAESKLFVYANKKLKLIDVSKENYKIYKVLNEIYVHKPTIGLMTYKNGTFTLIQGGELFIEKPPLDIFPYEKGSVLIKLSGKGFGILKNGKLEPFRTQVDVFLYQNEYSCGIVLSDGNYALGTSRCGFQVIDKKGYIVNSVNKEAGLNDDEISSFYIDKADYLWVSLSYGFSRVETPSPFSFYNRNSGIRGGVSSIVRHKGIIYIATTQGAFYLSPQTIFAKTNNCAKVESFIPVLGVSTSCNTFFSIKDELLLSTVDGVYQIDGFSGNKISEGHLESFYKWKIDTNIIFLAKKDGLSAIRHENGEWLEVGDFENLDYHIRTIAEDKYGNLWMGSNYDGVFMAKLSEGLNLDAEIFQFKNSNGLPKDHRWIDVYSTSLGVLFSTQKGVFRFDENAQTFYPDTLLGLDFDSGRIWVYPIREDCNKNIWLSSGEVGKFEKSTMVCVYDKDKNKYLSKKEMFINMKEFTCESIYPDNDGIIWFGGFDGIIRFNTLYKKKITSPDYVIFRKISVGEDSVLYLGGYQNRDSSNFVLPYHLNSLRFEFSAPVYQGRDAVSYQYFLEGFDKTWSEWTKTNIKEYTNLREGSYVFRVKAKDRHGIITETSNIYFSIRPPFYRLWVAYIIYLLIIGSFVLMVIKWRSYKHLQEKHKLAGIIRVRTEELVFQKERAEEVLANVLPKETADELKAMGKAKSQRFKMVTVLFADIQGFTKIAEQMNPEALIDELDKIFFYFDNIVEKFNIEKIKTIGDAYMCAGGIPQKNRTNPLEVVLAALDMQRNMEKACRESEAMETPIWGLRIGVHTGPVIAGVVGTKKYTYDIWGDTVNIASRMESSGEVSRINVTGSTYEMIKEYFECDYRGKMPVKYKGDIDMYFVNRIKPEYSENGDGINPNQRFKTKFQLILLNDIEEMVMNKMEKELPKNLYYHNLKHTVDVITQVELLGRSEGISDEDMLLLKTAAIFHDIGFTIGYDDHELLSIKIMQEMLRRFDYSEEQMQTISELIYSTQSPPEPKNLLEEIICDADLDYLGRPDFIPVSQNLFRELFERNKVKTIEEWNKMQIKFIEKHQYFTATARKLRNVKKQSQLDKLRDMI